MILFNLLLRLFPRAFRDAFGDDMRGVFVDQRRAAHACGRLARALFWGRTLAGMTTAAWRERRDGVGALHLRIPLESVVADLRLTARTLAARPLFTGVIVAALSIGVGGVATIFSGLNALVLRPLPGVSAGDRLVLLDRRTPDFSEGVSASVRFFEHLRGTSRTVSDVAVWSRVPLTIVVGQDAFGLSANIVSNNYFDLLGVRPAAGRFFAAGPGARMVAEPAIVLSHATWTSRFAGDPSAIGRSVAVNGRPYRIIGVAPAAFRGVFTPLKVDAWVPLAAQPHVHPQRDLADQPWLWAFGRLQAGIEAEHARTELSTLTAGWSSAGGDPFVRYTSMRLTPLTGLPDDARQALLGFGTILLGAAMLVLIIAAANVSTLLAMRATARRREMGIRTALGAGRGRLVRQLLTETLTLFLAGGVGGAFLAMAGTSALERIPVPSDAGLALELSPDLRVLGVAIAVSLGVGLVFGILPALRSAGRNPVALLKASSAGGGRRSRASSTLIVTQIACSVVLLTTAGLFVRAVKAGASIEPGFDARMVALSAFNTRAYGYDDSRGRAFYAALRQRLETAPGIDAVTYADRVPLTMSNSGATVAVDRPGAAGSERVRMRVELGVVDTAYFGTLGIRMFAGRDFTDGDAAGGPAAIVNETFARRAWPGGSAADAVGRTYFAGERPVTIVGVVADSKYSTLSEPPTPFVYRPQAQQWGAGQTLFVKASGDLAAAARLVQQAVASIDPLLPRPAVTTLERETSIALLPQRVAAIVTGVLGGAGLILAAIGLYGLVSYSVTLRLREIGVRLALGASRRDVVQMVLAQGLRLTAAGTVLGFAASVFVTRLLQGYLLDVSAMDPVAFGGAAIVLLIVAVLAAVVPARRAGSADPLVVLRAE